jgi:ABC-type sugar transport system permease subunit
MKSIWVFLLLPVALVCFLIIYPLSDTIYLAFTNWNGISPPEINGLRNIQSALSDPVFYQSLMDNVVWVIIFMVLTNGLGLFFSGALDTMGKRLSQFYRIILYISVLLPNVVISYLFLAVYDPQIGILNAFFNFLGLRSLGSTLWLANPHIAIFSVLASSIWQYAAFPMLIFLAAFTGIRPQVLEAAKIDGASEIQIFLRIKTRMIFPVIVTMLALTWIWNSSPFGPIFTMTQGGPANATQVLVTYLYTLGFNGYEFGYASTIALVLILIVVPVAVIFVRTFDK